MAWNEKVLAALETLAGLIDSGELPVRPSPPAALAGGLKAVAAAGGALAASSAPCKFVWVGAPITAAGEAVNTLPVFVGESAAQATYDKGPIAVMPANYEGLVIAIDDAAKLFVRAGDGNQKLAYRIFS